MPGRKGVLKVPQPLVEETQAFGVKFAIRQDSLFPTACLNSARKSMNDDLCLSRHVPPLRKRAQDQELPVATTWLRDHAPDSCSRRMRRTEDIPRVSLPGVTAMGLAGIAAPVRSGRQAVREATSTGFADVVHGNVSKLQIVAIEEWSGGKMPVLLPLEHLPSAAFGGRRRPAPARRQIDADQPELPLSFGEGRPGTAHDNQNRDRSELIPPKLTGLPPPIEARRAVMDRASAPVDRRTRG